MFLQHLEGETDYLPKPLRLKFGRPYSVDLVRFPKWPTRTVQVCGGVFVLYVCGKYVHCTWTHLHICMCAMCACLYAYCGTWQLHCMAPPPYRWTIAAVRVERRMSVRCCSLFPSSRGARVLGVVLYYRFLFLFACIVPKVKRQQVLLRLSSSGEHASGELLGRSAAISVLHRPFLAGVSLYRLVITPCARYYMQQWFLMRMLQQDLKPLNNRERHLIAVPIVGIRGGGALHFPTYNVSVLCISHYAHLQWYGCRACV